LGASPSRLMALLLDRLADRFSVVELSAAMHVSVRTLQTSFQTELGLLTDGGTQADASSSASKVLVESRTPPPKCGGAS